MENPISILKDITILYVEDEENIRKITSNILKDFTKQQLVAKDGKEGLELFIENQNTIDLIITDINMPNMSGFEMSKEIRAINSNIPIIVTSAFSETNYFLDAIDIHINSYILKPVDIKKLLNAMVKLLHYHELKKAYSAKLTNLPNKAKLNKDLESIKEPIVAIIDVNQFKNVIDVYGEDNSNELIIQLSKKIKEQFIDDTYTVYHTSIDTFYIVCNSEEISLDHFYTKCLNLSHEIENNSIIVKNLEIDINICVGIAKGENSLKLALRTLFYAKQKSTDQVLVHNHSYNIQESLEHSIMWIKKLKNAIKTEDRLKAYFQPIVDTKTKKIHKYEALIRYIEDDGTAIAPFTFLKIAKKAKLYHNIIIVMLKEALNLIIKKDKDVSINISYDDITTPKTREAIYKVLEENKEFTNKLGFEILESDEIEDTKVVANFIERVKKYGCDISIDDFGAGYSNFSLLTDFNIDYVKIDGSLIKDINQNRNKQIIVSTIANFSNEFKFKTIAEFVSNEEIYNIVKDIGVDYSQGYYFEKPIRFEDIV